MKKMIVLALLILIALFALSCSSVGSKDPVTSGSPDNELAATPKASLGFYTVELDPDSMTASVSVNRDLSYHMNAEPYLLGWPCGNCLKVKNLSFPPGGVECDIEITHPVSMPLYTVFDLRVIGVFTADKYFGSIGVSTAILNTDGLTNILDNPSIAGVINGYKAYNKTAPRRVFEPGSVSTEHFSIKIPSGGLTFDIGVDTNWMPNDGVTFPIEMNAFEVINLESSITPGMTSDGGSAVLTATMYDYQGTGTIASVKAISPALFNAPISLAQTSSDGHNATYQATVSNQKHASPGNYDILIAVEDAENIHYTYEVSSYKILTANVTPALHNVTVTLAEDDDAKTPGNYYDMSMYSGAAGPTVIDYFDTNGPWDFLTVHFTSGGRRQIYSPTDPEVSGFASSFPSATHFVKNAGSGVAQAYQAESHNYSSNKLMQYGLYEEDTIGGALVFTGTPNGFQYPYSTSTNFNVTFNGTYESLPASATWSTRGLGYGFCTVPYGDGYTDSALFLRTFVDIKVFYISVAKVLYYEWYDDDGNLLAIITSANIAGEPANFNESTYEITGTGAIGALIDYYRQ